MSRDGEEELVWTAASLSPSDAWFLRKPGEFVLLGLKKRGRLVTLRLVTARSKDPARRHYSLLPPVDGDRDGVMEVMVFSSRGAPGGSDPGAELLLLRLGAG